MLLSANIKMTHEEISFTLCDSECLVKRQLFKSLEVIIKLSQQQTHTRTHAFAGGITELFLSLYAFCPLPVLVLHLKK